jgi:hypothetical protein
MKRMALFLMAVLAAISWGVLVKAQSSPQVGVTAPPVSVTPIAIEERSAKVSSQQRAQADNNLMATARKVDHGAAKAGETAVATRLATEFGLAPEDLINERTKYKTGWGELVIAHTLAASMQGGMTADQLYGLRKSGMGWGKIAAGLGLSLQQTVSAVSAEGQVALGLAKPDGKVKRIPLVS